MPAHKRRPYRMSDDHREKIRNSQVLVALIEHVEGRREMSSSQVTAGVALLRKYLPDLSQQTVEVTDNRDVQDYSREELVAILRDKTPSSTGAVEASGSSGKPDSVH